jgi:ABC-type phosphate/phosphonate transport system permease subunit
MISGGVFAAGRQRIEIMAAIAPLGENGARIERHWQELAAKRRFYSFIGIVLFLLALGGSLWFANDTNSGKFFDRLPHVFDFVQELIPRDPWEIFRAMFDLPSPYDDGSFKYNYVEGRYYVTQNFYIPEYFYKMLETVNIAIFSTLIGMTFGFILSFLRRPQHDAQSTGSRHCPAHHGSTARLSRSRHRRLASWPSSRSGRSPPSSP